MVKPAATSNGMSSAIAMTCAGVAISCSRIAPLPIIAMTRSPTASPATPSPTASMTPAASPPGENGSGGLNW